MKREICVPEVPASQMVLTIITDEQLEAFADAVITKYQQSIARRKASEPMYSGGYPFSVPVIPVHFLGVKTDYLLRS